MLVSPRQGRWLLSPVVVWCTRGLYSRRPGEAVGAGQRCSRSSASGFAVLRILLVHPRRGVQLHYQGACAGPSVELVKHFVTYAFCTRDLVSAIGREGLGDSFELQIRYMLAKFVFPALEHNGWIQ